MVLAAKGLKYRVVNITPGIGQLEIFQLSGQRQVPVLTDEESVFTGSRTIVRYLEKLQPEPKLISDNPKEAGIINLIENWADTTMAKACKQALFQAISLDDELRECLIPSEVPNEIKKLINKLPYGILNNVSGFLNQREKVEFLSNLENLTMMVESNRWLVGDSMSFADISIAAQLSLLRFPKSAGANLSGKGCPGLSDNPSLEKLFVWRDQLENSLFEE